MLLPPVLEAEPLSGPNPLCNTPPSPELSSLQEVLPAGLLPAPEGSQEPKTEKGKAQKRLPNLFLRGPVGLR